MRLKSIAHLVAVGLLVGLAGIPAAGAEPEPAPPVQPTARAAWSPLQPFSREPVARGDVDADPWHIEHVYEVQLRLKRLGFFDEVHGRFGPRTERAVKAFQKSRGLPETGVVEAATWRPLIRRSLRGRDDVPAGCLTKGWHACYDRKHHQVSLYRGGTMRNSWFVRGGAADTPTRTGTFKVYLRDIDHYSAMFDAPMPYSQFFSGGQALHGSRLMMNPFVGHSHGCVNFWVEDARQLWKLTSTKPLWVHVYGAWN